MIDYTLFILIFIVYIVINGGLNILLGLFHAERTSENKQHYDNVNVVGGFISIILGIVFYLI